ncbi:octanoyltransferase [Bacteroidia bacterium]|nr:octanoyltransferase [Bacteroidia bacterium]
MNFFDWGLVAYAEAWDRQRDLAAQLLAAKAAGGGAATQYLIFCEHPHVYTLGRNGNKDNFLISETLMSQINASLVCVDRGGDITYHGPGQIVGYPILDLERLHLSLKGYVWAIEEAVINTLRRYGIVGERWAGGAAGVWVDAQKPAARKICAIGIHASRYVTTHGFALNVNTNLDYFCHINPCGLADKGVTSMQKELHRTVDTTDLKALLRQELEQQLTNTPSVLRQL